MTLPANDAFTLGLAHDGTARTTRTRSRSITRSPSPLSNMTTSRVERGLARRASKRANSGSNVVSSVESSTSLEEIQEKREDSPQPAVLPPVKPTPTAIDWEIPRKLLHSSIGFFTLYLYYANGSPRKVVIVLATALVTVIAPADAIRLRYPAFERLYEKLVGFLMRESERKSTNGVIWYILGALFVLICYPLDIAIVSILILAWADTNASTFGRLWGRYTPALPASFFGLPLAPRKSLAGFIAGSLTGALTTVTFYSYIAPRAMNPEVTWTWDQGVVGYGLSGANDVVGVAIKNGMASLGITPVHTGGWIGLGIIGIVAGIVSGVAEALDLGNLDDNLTLPIISGGCLWGFFKLLGYVSS